MSDREGRTFTLPRAAWAALAVFGILQVALLAINALGIGRQEQLLERQLGLAEQTYDATRPAVQDARRLLDDARDRLPATRRRAREAAELVQSARPLVEGARPLVDSARPLVDSARPLVDTAVPLVDALAEMDAAGALATAGQLALELRQDARLVALVDRSLDLLRDLDRTDAVDGVRDLRGTLHELLSVQRRTLSTQLQTLDVQRRTLVVQEEALRHIRSLDRKTGGELPGP